MPRTDSKPRAADTPAAPAVTLPRTRARGAGGAAVRMILSVLALFIVPLPAHALKSDADQPINIRARSVEANEKTGVTVYRGDVSMVQGSTRIQGDRIEVVMRNERVQSVQATGKPVKVRTRSDRGEELRAQALRAQYSAPKQQLDLYGDVLLERDKDVLRGATVRYNLGTEELIAEGSRDGQVSAVIQPAPAAP